MSQRLLVQATGPELLSLGLPVSPYASVVRHGGGKRGRRRIGRGCSRPRTTFVADSDCERTRERLLSQPANAVSSLAYAAAGAWVSARSHGSREARAFSAILMANGIGGFAYHGPGGQRSHRAHDYALASLCAFAVVSAARSTSRRRLRNLSATPLILLSIAGSIYLLSRTGGFLCRPHGVIQGHALWHVLSALALALWAQEMFAPREDATLSNPGAGQRPAT